ncbi:MAG: ACT domain-containing protein [Ferruginibacter sp.]|nr:ACT domain-containing protein [Ferruginibacter sp.]
MPGEKNLELLLANPSPFLNDGAFVFCSLPETTTLDWRQAIAIFRETEGITVIVSREIAEEMKLPYETVFSWITLRVHSSLEAVGLTAAFSAALAGAAISCNVMAAYHHDHIFVPQADAARAMEVLSTLKTVEQK